MNVNLTNMGNKNVKEGQELGIFLATSHPISPLEPKWFQVQEELLFFLVSNFYGNTNTLIS